MERTDCGGGGGGGGAVAFTGVVGVDGTTIERGQIHRSGGDNASRGVTNHISGAE